jgi:hypothetical protein
MKSNNLIILINILLVASYIIILLSSCVGLYFLVQKLLNGTYFESKNRIVLALSPFIILFSVYLIIDSIRKIIKNSK